MSRVVVFQGGLFANSRAYPALRAALELEGCTVFVSPVARLGFASVERDAHALEQTVATASMWSSSTGGGGDVSIVGHSKGGIVARYFLQRGMAGSEHVDQLLMLAMPNNGMSPLGPTLSRLAARYLHIKSVEQLESHSGMITSLNAGLPDYLAAARAVRPDFRMASIAADMHLPGPLAATDGFVKLREALFRASGPANALAGAMLLPGLENYVVGGATHLSVASELGTSKAPVELLASLLHPRDVAVHGVAPGS